MKKKLLALLVTVAMLFTMVPTAFADVAEGTVATVNGTGYTTLAEAIAHATDGETVTLEDDVTANGIVTQNGQTLTLDLNKHTYTINSLVGSAGTVTSGMQLLKGSTVTIKNGTIQSGITGMMMLIQNYSNLTLDDVTLDGTGLSGTGDYTLSNNCGTVNITGDTSITAKAGSYAMDACWAPNNGYPEGAQVTIDTTGTITGDIQFDLWGTDGDGDCLTTLAINNAILKGKIDVESNMEKYVDNIKIQGGTFSDLSVMPYLTADSDVTVKLDKDIDLDSQLIVNTKLTLDLNGHTISNSTDIWNDAEDVKAWSQVSAQAGGNLTITGDGKLAAKENDCYAVDVRDGASCVIENGTFIGNISAAYVHCGSLTVNGGTFSIQQLSETGNGGDQRFTLNCLDGSYKNESASITVNGGTFEKFNPADCLAEGTGTNFVSDDSMVTGPDENSWYTVSSIVAKIENTNYATLADAVAVAQTGDTVTLMKDAVGNGMIVPSGTNFTLDLNGNTYTIDGTTVGSTGTETNGFQLLKDSNITIKNGKITSNKAKILIQNYCSLTLDGVTLDGRNLVGTAPYTLSNNCGNVVIKNSTITAKDGGLAFDACDFSTYTGVTVTVEGSSVINGKFECTNPNGGDNNAKIVINGGAFTDLADAVNYVADGATIKLAADVSLANTLTIDNGMAVTLDLNGHTLSRTSLPIKVLHGTLNVIGTGTIQETKDDQYAPVYIRGSENPADSNYSVVTIGKDVTLKGWAGLFIDQLNAHAYGVVATIDGKLYSPAETGFKASGYGIYVNGQIHDKAANCPQITIGPDAVVNADNSTSVAGSTAVYAAGYAKWIINGGTFTGHGCIEIKAGSMTINGGSFTATASPSHATNNDGTSTGGYALAVVENEGYGNLVGVIVNNGTFNGPVSVLDDATGDVKTDSILTVTGGSFANLSGLAYTQTGKTYTLSANTTIAKGETVTVPSGVTLAIAPSATLTNNGTIKNLGTVTGSVVNNATITGNEITGVHNTTPAEIVSAVADKVKDITTDTAAANVETVKKAVEAVQVAGSDLATTTTTEAGSTSLGISTAKQETLGKLEELIVEANTNVQTSVPAKDTEIVTGVKVASVANAALSVDPNVTTATTAAVTVAAGTVPTGDAAAAAKIEALKADNSAVVIPIDIGLTVGGTAVQPVVPLLITLDVTGISNPQKLRIVHEHDNDVEVIVPTVKTEGNTTTISFYASKLSTFTIVETSITNNNAFKVNFVPTTENVNGGDEIAYDVMLQRVAGEDPIGLINLNLAYTDTYLTLGTFTGESLTAVDGTAVTPNYADGIIQADFADNNGLTVGTAAVKLGTITATVKNQPADTVDGSISIDAGFHAVAAATADKMTSISSTGGYPDAAGLEFNTTAVTYRNLKVTLNYGDSTSKSETFYAKYNEAGLYTYDATSGYKSATPTAINTLIAPEGYRLFTTPWLDASGNAKTMADITGMTYTGSATYTGNWKPEYAVSSTPAHGTVEVADKAAQDFDLTFTVSAASGYKVSSVSYKIGSGEPQTLNANANGSYTIPGTSITGAVAITVTYANALTAHNITVFTDDNGFVPYSTYSGSKTLVLFKAISGVENINISGVEVFKLPEGTYTYEENGTQSYAFAALVDASNWNGSKDAAGMVAVLNGLNLTYGGTPTTLNVGHTYVNGKTGDAAVVNVQCAYDISRTTKTSQTLKWTPTDADLLAADVLTYDSTAHTYTVGRDGKVDSADVQAFLYDHAKFARP